MKGERHLNIYNILFPPETEYVGWVQFATLTKDKKLLSLGYTDFEHIEEKGETLEYKKSQNYYVMANTVKRYTTRTSDNLFSLNNIVLDYDIHSNISRYEREQLIDEFVWRLNRDLFTTGELITPNVVHYTGRGVQLWFHIESTSAKLLFLYHKAIDYIAIIIREWLKEYPTLQRHIEPDISSSKNAVGLFRMFNTYNTKAKTMTVADVLHDKAINLNDLVKQLEDSEPVKEYLKRKEQIKKRYKKQELNEDYEPEERKSGYSALHYKRIKIIEELARETENPVGHRDIMIFLVFNSARQIYPFETAKKICRKINRSFSEPLPDIEYIFKQDKVYQIKNSTFFEKLGVSQDELINMGKYEMSRPNITRDLARGQRKAERQMKKDMAEKFIKSGMTLKDVAERTGLSVSTVSKLSAGIPKSKKQKK